MIHVVHKEKQHVNNIEDTDIIYNMLNIILAIFLKTF